MTSALWTIPYGYVTVSNCVVEGTTQNRQVSEEVRGKKGQQSGKNKGEIGCGQTPR